jgi:hypothetical protein
MKFFGPHKCTLATEAASVLYPMFDRNNYGQGTTCTKPKAFRMLSILVVQSLQKELQSTIRILWHC